MKCYVQFHVYPSIHIHEAVFNLSAYLHFRDKFILVCLVFSSYTVHAHHSVVNASSVLFAVFVYYLLLGPPVCLHHSSRTPWLCCSCCATDKQRYEYSTIGLAEGVVLDLELLRVLVFYLSWILSLLCLDCIYLLCVKQIYKELFNFCLFKE